MVGAVHSSILPRHMEVMGRGSPEGSQDHSSVFVVPLCRQHCFCVLELWSHLFIVTPTLQEENNA